MHIVLLCARFVPVVISTKVQIGGVGLCYHRNLGVIAGRITYANFLIQRAV